jgi:hypothetical protein
MNVAIWQLIILGVLLVLGLMAYNRVGHRP